MENKTALPHFHGWSKVEEGYYTKTRLKNEFGLKPLNPEEHDATLKAYMDGKWKDFVLYHMDNCVEIKKRKVIEHPITNLRIAEALYLINKSAKVSRDTKKENYYARKHAVVQAAKTRQYKYYDLKEAVIKKLTVENKVNIKGYHEMGGQNFILIELEGFTFHKPVYLERDLERLEKLGELTQPISSEKSISVSLNFWEAENLLNRYINQN